MSIGLRFFLQTLLRGSFCGLILFASLSLLGGFSTRGILFGSVLFVLGGAFIGGIGWFTLMKKARTAERSDAP